MKKESRIALLKLGSVIKSDKQKVVRILRESGVKVPDSTPRAKLSLIISKEMFTNDKMNRKLDDLFVSKGFSNADGDDDDDTEVKTKSTKGGGGGWLGAISGIFGGVMGAVNQKQVLKQQQAQAHQQMMSALTKQKTDYLPYIVIGGVFIIGGIVVFKMI